MKCKIQDKKYTIIDNFGFQSSNNEVTFNDVKIDFKEHPAEDIPYKYQKVKIIDDDDVVKFTGYVDNVEFSHLTTGNSYKELTLTLLSPLKMATRRTVSLIGTYDIQTAITRILQPLFDDGYRLAEINVPNGQITTSFVLETVENAMNIIGFKRNIFWRIDEQENIFVNSIDYLFGQKSKMEITENKVEHLLELQPTISNIDYANIINFKNVRLVYSTSHDSFEYQIVPNNKVIKQGDTVEFTYPIILDEEWLRNKMKEYNDIENTEFHALNIAFTGGAIDYVISRVQGNANYDRFVLNGNLSVTFNDSGGSEGDIVLIRDSFFKELITGFKWNKAQTTLIASQSDIALRYTTMRFLYSKEIEKLKGIISNSGQIEKTVDYEEKWTTIQQLIDYARSLIVQNSNVINEVKLKFDKNPDLCVGDIIEIDRPNYFINGKFAVKDILYTNSKNIESWIITAKNSDFISSYLDLFRPTEKQSPQSSIDTVILSEFVEDSFAEKHDVVDYESDEDKAIRLAKEAWDEETPYGIEGWIFAIQGYGQTDDDYIVAVRDPETSYNLGYVYVNIETEECEVEW